MENERTSAAFLQPSPEMAARIENILGIVNNGAPGDGWSGIKMEIASDEFATVQVTFLISVDQAVEIAQLMRSVPAMNGYIETDL